MVSDRLQSIGVLDIPGLNLEPLSVERPQCRAKARCGIWHSRQSFRVKDNRQTFCADDIRSLFFFKVKRCAGASEKVEGRLNLNLLPSTVPYFVRNSHPLARINAFAALTLALQLNVRARRVLHSRKSAARLRPGSISSAFFQICICISLSCRNNVCSAVAQPQSGVTG